MRLAKCLVVGLEPPGKIRHKNLFFARNYHGDSPNVVIAIVSIPVIDVQLITGVDTTNIGNVGTNLYKEYLSVSQVLTVASPSNGVTTVFYPVRFLIGHKEKYS